MNQSTQRVLVHVAALCTALIGAYTLLGFLVLPYWIERKLPDLLEPIGAHVSVEGIATNPFLLTMRVRGVTVSQDHAPPVLQIPELFLDLSLASLVERAWIVEQVAIRNPQLNLVRDVDGRINLSALLGTGSSVGGTVDPAQSVPSRSDPPPLVLQSITVQDGRIDYVDRMHPKPMQMVVGPLALRAENLSTVSDTRGLFHMETALPGNGSARANGDLALRILVSEGTVRLESIALSKFVPFAMTAQVIEPPEGQLDLSFRYRLSMQEGNATIALDDLTAALTRLSLRQSDADQSMVDLADLSIAGGAVDYNARTVVLQKVELRQGRIDARIDAEGQMDLASIAEAFAPADPPPPSAAAPWNVSVASFRLEAVALAYTDPAGTLVQDARISSSALQFSADATVGAGRLDALLQDVGLELNGILIGKTVEDATLRLASVRLKGGVVDTRQRRIRAGTVDLSDGLLSLSRNAHGALEFPGTERTNATGTRSRAALRDAGEVVETVVDDGLKLNSPAATWQIAADALKLNQVGLRYADRASPVPVWLDVERAEAAMRIALSVGTDAMHIDASDIYVSLDNVALAGGDASEPAVTLSTLRLNAGAFDTNARVASAKTLEFDGLRASVVRDDTGMVRLARSEGSRGVPHVTPAKLSPDTDRAQHEEVWNIKIERISGNAESVHYRDNASSPEFTASVDRTQLSLALDAAVADTVRVVVDALDARFNGITLQASGENAGGAELSHVAVEQGSVDTAARRFAAQSILLAGGRLPLERSGRGSVLLAGITLADETESKTDVQPEAGAWLYDIATFRVENVGLALADRGYSPAVAYDVTLDLSAQPLRSGHSEPVVVDATARLARGGSIRAAGTLTQAFSAGSVHLRVNELALAPLAPILARYAFLDVASGAAFGEAQLRFGEPPDSPRLLLEGNMRLADVLINETRAGKPFISWKTVDAREIAIGLDPNRIDIAEVIVSAPQAELIVSEDRTLNLSRVLRDDGQVARAEDRWQDAFPIRVGRISVSQGQLQFADLSLVLPFSTRVDELQGVVVGLSSAADARAELELTGRIADHGSASARGGLNAFDPARFTDIIAKFDNVLIPPFSPYTATFAGRTIESGRLWLDLEYRIVERKLFGQNKVVVQNLELGERVQAPNAADLPLELAVALLQDDQGRINLQIPVSGNLGDPQFDYGSLIANAIGSTLRRIVSAPFRALASLFGGDDAEEVRNVRFRPGTEELAPAERQQLEQVAKALQARPALRLLVHGPFDPVHDARALRDHEIRRAVSVALGRPADESARGDPIALTDPHTQEVLEKLLHQRLTETDYRAFKHISGPSDPHYYQAILAELAARVEIDESRLNLLAANRARAISSALTDSGVSPDRIQASEVRRVTDDDSQAVAATLELDVLARSSASRADGRSR